MDFFKDVHSVRLLGHKGKFLWADDDRRSVAQKKGQDSYGVIWRVELVPERKAIRLKSVYDLYLIASDYPFLLGATGKKVMQSFDSRAENVEWEPLSAGEFVKLRTKGDKFLRANGGMPPYRNSVTHDVPVLASNQHVVLWEVDVVRRKGPAAGAPVAPPPQKQKPKLVVPPKSPPPRYAQGPGSSENPEDSVQTPLYEPRPRPRRHSAPEDIEFPLPSASESSSPVSDRFSPIAGPPRRQRQPSSPPSQQSVDNSPRRGRAPVPPNPVPVQDEDEDEDDSPSSSLRAPPRQHRHRATVSEIPTHFTTRHDDDDDDGDDQDEIFSPSPRKPKVSNINVIDTSSPSYSSRLKSPSDYRRIFYTVAEDNGEVFAHDDDTFGSFLFKGHTLMELTEALQLETGIDDDVVLCMRNPITSKLYKMRLQLPPNRAPLSVVIVRHNSQFGRTLSLSGSRRR